MSASWAGFIIWRIKKAARPNWRPSVRGSETKRAGDWTGISGNFGPPGEQIDVSGLGVYESLDAMLEDDSIDLIDICLPPSLHAEAIEKSLAAGKSVLCEKPLALSFSEADRLAELGGDRLMVAQVLPFMPEFGLLVQAAEDGRWGKPIAGRFKRTISPPHWIPDFYNSDSVGGPLIDLHVHDAHLIRLLFGMPTSVESKCLKKEGVPRFYETMFRYPEDYPVSAGGGVIESPARGFTHGYEVSFEQATVQFEICRLLRWNDCHDPLNRAQERWDDRAAGTR